MPRTHKTPVSGKTHIVLAGVLLAISGLAIAAQLFLLSKTPSLKPGYDTGFNVPSREHFASMLVASADVRTQAPQLQGLRIEPNPTNGLMLLPSQTVRLTSVGLFATMEQQIASRWSLLRGVTEEPISNCESVKTCAFTPQSGMDLLHIIARNSGYQDLVMVRVLEDAASPFSDPLPSWASSAILRLHSSGIIRGYDNGRFGAGDPLRRGQVAVLLARVLEQSGLANAPSSCAEIARIPSTHYAYSALCLFAQRGWEPDRWADPEEVITRGETAAYINRIFGPSLLRGSGTSQGAVLTAGQTFSDVPTDNWYFFDVGVMQLSAIMTGNPDGTFGVYSALNRAEAAVVTERLLDTINRLNIQQL